MVDGLKLRTRMNKQIKIGDSQFTFVLRHRWEKGSKSILDNYDANKLRKELSLGVYFKKDKVVGRVKKGSDKGETVKNTFNVDNMVNDYYVGLNLIVCKFWVNFSFKPTFGSNYKD